MREKKDGLTPQQEAFCQAYVDGYGCTEREKVVNAYRKAYNCSSDANEETHRRRGYEMLKDGTRTAQRIKMLKDEIAKDKTIERGKVVTRNVKIMDIDPLADLFITDEVTKKKRPRRLDEIREEVRKLLHPVFVRGKLVWLPDKKLAEKIVIDLMGFESAKEINLNHNQVSDDIFYFGDFEDSDISDN